MSPVLEKTNLIGEAPGHRPGDVQWRGLRGGYCSDLPLRDVYARLADGMSPADH